VRDDDGAATGRTDLDVERLGKRGPSRPGLDDETEELSSRGGAVDRGWTCSWEDSRLRFDRDEAGACMRPKRPQACLPICTTASPIDEPATDSRISER
jgi:hypothetical protein